MQPRHVFSHSNKIDQNELKHHYWVLKRWIGCVRFVSGPKVCIVSLKGRTGALNATPAWFSHSIKTDQNERKHHYWVQKGGFGAFASFLDRNYASFRKRAEPVH